MLLTLPLDAFEACEDGIDRPVAALVEPLLAKYQFPEDDNNEVLRCPCCKREYVVFNHAGRFRGCCSERCERRRKNAGRVRALSERRAEARAGRLCNHCGGPIDAARSTKRFCSPRCRVAAFRARLTVSAASSEAAE